MGCDGEPPGCNGIRAGAAFDRLRMIRSVIDAEEAFPGGVKTVDGGIDRIKRKMISALAVFCFMAEHGYREFEKTGKQPEGLDKYKMLIGAYLKPELAADTVSRLEDAGIVPAAGLFLRSGLADAAKRLALETGLGVKVYADKIPFEGNSFALGREMDIDPVSAALSGGDDCQLLFVVPILSLEKFRKEFPTFDIVGHLAEPSVGAVLVTPDGAELPIHAPGWPED